MSGIGEKDARTALLLGEAGFSRLQKAAVAVVGLGGVGGICAEALARSGVGRLHLIDADIVAESNLNRQVAATKAALGMQKTAAMAERIQAVSDCAVTVSNAFIRADTVADALPETLSAIADAIDYVPGKVALAQFAKARGVPLVCCLGAGNRMDPTAFTVTDLYATSGCPLAKKLRTEMKKAGITSLPVVFSHEPAKAAPEQRTVGSMAPVTGTAGLILAAQIIKIILSEEARPLPAGDC